MIDSAAVGKGAVASEANKTFDDLVSPDGKKPLPQTTQESLTLSPPKLPPKTPALPTKLPSQPPQQGRFFIGGRGDDSYTGTSKADFAYGGGGNDTLKGRAGNDILSGGRGNDTLNGGSGNDRLYGGGGNDTIRTGTGDDTVRAGRGDDKIVVKGGAKVDGGAGHDTVVLKGARTDYIQSKRVGPNQLFVDQRDGSRVELTNVETVRFSEVTPPEPPLPPTGKGQPLAPNDAGAERIIVGPDSIRIIGPSTDFTFTDLRDQRPVDGPLTALAGSGIINGEQTTAVPLGFGDAVFSLGSGFNPTGTQAVQAAFANGVELNSQIVRPTGPTPIPVPVPPISEPAPLPPVGGQRLGPNTVGAERIIVSPGSVRIIGPNTDFTFTGIRDGRPADGPLTATAGSGIINGVQTTAVPLGSSDPFQPDNGAVFSLSSGFNPTGTQTVMAAFATGDRLDTTILQMASLPLPPIETPDPTRPILPYQPPVSIADIQ